MDRKQVDWATVDHFEPDEFDDPRHPGSWVHMAPETIYCLDRLREQTGWPIETHNKYGLRGCVCVDQNGHSHGSRHYVANQCDAVDWHFVTDESPRIQAMRVMQSGFTGIGIYYDWHWIGGKLLVGFHTDRRKRPQIWKEEKGKRIYLLK